MADNLFDIIKNNIGTTTTQQVGTSDTGQQANTLLAAKTGKAAPASPGIASSNLAETSANDATRAQQGQLAVGGAIAGQQVAQAAQQNKNLLTNQKIDITQKAAANQQSYQIGTEQTIQDLSNGEASLSADEKQAKLDQLSHNLAMQDQKYVDQLQQVGAEQRLDTDLGFKQAIAKATFADQEDLLSDNLMQQASTATDMRDLSKTIAGSRLVDMINADYLKTQAAQKQGLYSAVGGSVSAGVGGYGDYQKQQQQNGGASGTDAWSIPS